MTERIAKQSSLGFKPVDNTKINDRRSVIDEVVNEGVDEMSMSVSRDNDAEIDLQGQDEFHQQGQRAKHKHQNPKEETLYKK